MVANGACSNMVANILTEEPLPLTMGWGQKVIINFSEHGPVAFQEITDAAPCKHIFCPYTHPRPKRGVKGQNIYF